MRIVENLKSSYTIRMITYSILLLLGLGLMISSYTHGSLFIWSILPIGYGVYYIVSDLIMIKSKRKITPIESKSKQLLWVLVLSITLPVAARLLSDNKEQIMEWSAFVLSISIIGIIQIMRENSILSDTDTVERLGFLSGARMRWSDVNGIIRDSERITIQSTEKNYITIDIKRSTAREVRLIEDVLRRIAIDENHNA